MKFAVAALAFVAVSADQVLEDADTVAQALLMVLEGLNEAKAHRDAIAVEVAEGIAGLQDLLLDDSPLVVNLDKIQAGHDDAERLIFDDYSPLWPNSSEFEDEWLNQPMA